MMENKIEIAWIGRCVYGTEDKIWSWIKIFSQTGKLIENYAFWSLNKKDLQLTQFGRGYEYKLNSIKTTKIKNKYNEITLDDLNQIWPTYLTDIEYKLIWNKLSEKI